MERLNREKPRIQVGGQMGNPELSQRDQQQLTAIEKEANAKILSYIRSQDELNISYQA